MLNIYNWSTMHTKSRPISIIFILLLNEHDRDLIQDLYNKGTWKGNMVRWSLILFRRNSLGI